MSFDCRGFSWCWNQTLRPWTRTAVKSALQTSVQDAANGGFEPNVLDAARETNVRYGHR